MSWSRVIVGWLLVAGAGLPGCAHDGGARISGGPRLRILGTVQDGGLPHTACDCRHCAAARRDPGRRRYVASLAILLPRQHGDAVYLVDATPDIRSQLDLLRSVRKRESRGVDRSPVEGVFLTHAHMGHYLGLAQFGFEAVNTNALKVYCTQRMAAFLASNGPWNQLVGLGNIELKEATPGTAVTLTGEDGAARVSVTPLQVPHRDEYSDTVGFVIRGVAAAGDAQDLEGAVVLYVPDTEPLRTWKTPLPDVVERERVTVLILDGTFYSQDELPGRPVASIGHPLMTDSMAQLEPLVRAGRLRVLFTHLNHSNPALDPTSDAAAAIKRRRFAIAAEGDEIAL